jgi:hypothetical protein
MSLLALSTTTVGASKLKERSWNVYENSSKPSLRQKLNRPAFQSENWLGPYLFGSHFTKKALILS